MRSFALEFTKLPLMVNRAPPSRLLLKIWSLFPAVRVTLELNVMAF